MDTGLEQITEAELMQMVVDDNLIDLHVSMPAKVQSYNKDKQTVNVVPMLRRAVTDGAGGFVTQSLPALADVPVCFPRVGAFFMSFPIKAGDFVLLIFCERNIGTWRALGSEADPGDLGRHTLDGAVAIPGIFPDSKPIKNAHATNMVLGSDTNANGRIELTPTEVHLGAGASKQVVRVGDDVDMGQFQCSGVGSSFAGIIWTPPGGGPPQTITTSPVGLTGQAATGSAHVKAVD